MSQVAALLLMYMDEEDAFWGLSQLMTHHKYGMHGKPKQKRQISAKLISFIGFVFVK